MAGVDWVNKDGLLVRFGPNQGNRNGRAGITTDSSKHRNLVLTVDLTGVARTIYPDDLTNSGTANGFSSLNTPIPNGAVITSQRVVIKTPLAGGTNFAVGTYAKNGTVDTANGIRTTAGADGAQVGTQVAADKYIGVVTTGTYTAGVVEILIGYAL